eukprot:4486052-Amphidinium_carterae.1
MGTNVGPMRIAARLQSLRELGHSKWFMCTRASTSWAYARGVIDPMHQYGKPNAKQAIFIPTTEDQYARRNLLSEMDDEQCGCVPPHSKQNSVLSNLCIAILKK